MTLISVTRTILKPTSPDDGGRGFRKGRVGPGIHATTGGAGDSCNDGWGRGFMQNSHGIRVVPEFRCRCLWPAGTSQPRGRASDTRARHHAEFGWFSAFSDGFSRFGRFLEGAQPATRQAMRWAQVDQQEHPASPETPADGETTPAAEPAPAPASDPVATPAAEPVPALASDPVPASAVHPVTAPASGPMGAPQGRDRRAD